MKYLIALIFFVNQAAWCAEIVTYASQQGASSNSQNGSYKWIAAPIGSDSLPHGCVGTCRFGFFEINKNLSSGSEKAFHTSNDGSLINVVGVTTWAEAHAMYQSAHGTQGNITSYWAYGPNSLQLICATFGIIRAPAAPEVPRDQLITQPGVPCTTTVVLNSCIIYDENILLDHGNLSPNEIDGHKAKSNFSVACSSSLSVSFNTSPSGDLILKSGEIRNHLTIEGKELDNSLSMSADVHDLEIESTLSAEKSITSGTFGGSQTLIITIE